ncbi:MAG: AIPR family protein [Planctomycetia bacterium]|nr:AIPR family protein [Planctomycetia bacterium]
MLWFLWASVAENEEQAAKAVTGGARDKGIDGMLIDDAARAVFVVQGKYHKELLKKNETRADIVSFAEVSQRLCEPDSHAFAEYLRNTDALVAERLQEARKKVLKQNYRVWLYFVTLGKVSHSHRKDAEQLARKADRNTRIEILDGKDVIRVVRDWLVEAQPIPRLDLEMESGHNVTVNGVAQRYDGHTKTESWVFSMRGDAIAQLYERAHDRLFARNIRGFLGVESAVNEGMEETLEGEPERFFYYNNGITIVCDKAKKESSQGRDILRVDNPQIINGQQTTRTLAAHPEQAGKASVLVKVIQVPRSADEDGDAFEEIVSRIVAGTNWQNAIRPSDLMSNDRKQTELGRALRKIGYTYIRKRQSKGEARRLSGNMHYYVVKKEELAQAAAGCDLDPYIIRSGREKLFGEKYYSLVFPNSDPDHYLPRFRLMRQVTRCSRGYPSRGYAKWMVLNFMWSTIGPLVRAKRNARTFRIMCEKQTAELVVPLSGAINTAFVQALRYFRANRGTGAAAVDISTFFKSQRNHHKQFEAFWESCCSSGAKLFQSRLEKVKDAIEAFEG